MAYSIDSWTELNKIRITDAGDPDYIGGLSEDYILTADLSKEDLDYVGIGDSWVPLGESDSVPFGTHNTFDGNNHTISDLVINHPTEDSFPGNYVGLFGYAYYSTIKDLTLEDVDIIGGSYVGALVGFNRNTRVSNCHVNKGTISGKGTIGGLVGLGSSSDYLTDCTVTNAIVSQGEATGDNLNVSYIYVGGLVGSIANSYESCENCYFEGQINVFPAYTSYFGVVGGFAGRLSIGTENCSAEATITIFPADSESALEEQFAVYIGGFAGHLWINSASINKCKADVDIISYQAENPHWMVGGFIGHSNGDSEVTNCYAKADIDITSAPVSSNYGYVGGFIGFKYPGLNIENCYVRGEIKLDESTRFGGFVGNADGDATPEITNCFTTLKMTGLADEKGGFAGRLTTTSENCGWWTGQEGGPDYALGVYYDYVDDIAKEDGSITHETSDYTDFYFSTHGVYTDAEPYWDFDTIWVVNLTSYPTFEIIPVEEIIEISDSIEINPGIEYYDIFVKDSITYGLYAAKNIDQDFRTCKLVLNNTSNIFNTVIETKEDLNSKFNFGKFNIVDFLSKTNTCFEYINNPLNYIRFFKGNTPEINNNIRSMKEQKSSISNNFRMLTEAQVPGDAGFQSLGKEYVKVYFNSVEQLEINVDTISIDRSINSPGVATFTMAVPYDSENKPEQETEVEIKYNDQLLYKGYIIDINPSDSPDSISIECRDKLWKDNRDFVYFSVGHTPKDEDHKWYNTIKGAISDVWGLNYNLGDFVPEDMNLTGTNKIDALIQLIQHSGNYNLFYDVNENPILQTLGSGDVINLDAQELGKNIKLHNVLSHSLNESIEGLINRYYVQMGHQVPGYSNSDVPDSNVRSNIQWRIRNTVSLVIYPQPRWIEEFKFQGFSPRGINDWTPSEFDYKRRDPKEPDWKYDEVFTSYTLPAIVEHYETWSDIEAPKVYLDSPPAGMGSFSASTRRPGWVVDGFSVDFENSLFNFSSPVYYKYYKQIGSLQYDLNAIKKARFTLHIWKERWRTFGTGVPPSGEYNPPYSPDWEVDEGYYNDFAFWTDKMGDYPQTISGFLGLSGYGKQSGMVWVDDAGNPTIIRAVDDTPFAKDIANWNLSKVCDKKINGDIKVTIDTLSFYNIDLDKRVRVKNVQDIPLNITGINIDFSNFTATLSLERGRTYKRTVSVNKYSKAKTGSVVPLSSVRGRSSSVTGSV